MEYNDIEIVYVFKKWFNRDHNLSDEEIKTIVRTFSSGINQQTLYKTEPVSIPDNLEIMPNVLTFYSKPSYKNMYDYFVIPEKSVSRIQIRFKDKQFNISVH